MTEKKYKCEHKIVREMRLRSVRFHCIYCGRESAFHDRIELEEVKKHDRQ